MKALLVSGPATLSTWRDLITASTNSTHFFVLFKNVNRQEVGCLYCAKYYPSVTSLRYTQSEWHQRSSAIRKFPTCCHPLEGSENTRAGITQQNRDDITDRIWPERRSFQLLIFCKYKIKNAVFKYGKFFVSCAYKENVPSIRHHQTSKNKCLKIGPGLMYFRLTESVRVTYFN